MSFQKNFTVRNGIVVNENLIFADSESGKVGIATTEVNYTFHVRGGIGATNSVITGVSTVNTLVINGQVSIGNSTGSIGEYLSSVGSGVSWKSPKVPRESTVYSAGIGSTSFSVSYEVGLVDVYINGVRLVPPPSSYAEFAASNGSNIILNDPCFGGEIVELVVYNRF